MNLEPCLLITDDPDDQEAFSEAIAEVNADLVLILITNGEKALEWIKQKKCLPRYIFMDLTMHGIRANSLLKLMSNDSQLAEIPVILYGEESDLEKIQYRSHRSFLNKNFTYTELRAFLTSVLE